MKIIQYNHKFSDMNSSYNSVFEELKGKHRDHCLCHQNCKFFKPDHHQNCEIAQSSFDICFKYGIVTPMWECPKYETREKRGGVK